MFGVDAASIDDRLVFIFGDDKFGEFDTMGQRGQKLLFESILILFKGKAKGAAEDDLIGANAGDDGTKTDGDAVGDFVPIGFAGDFVGEFAVVVGDSFGGGKIFPFEDRSVEFVLVVTGFVGANAIVEVTVTNDAAANTGGKSQVDREAGYVFGFGEGGEIGIIFEEDREIE